MRISVFLPHQELTEQPAHETSRKIAKQVMQYARIVGQNAIQLTTSDSWRTIKQRLRPTVANPEVPRIKPPRAPEGLLLTYPIRDMRSGIYS